MSAKAKITGSVVAEFPSPAEQYLEPLGVFASLRVANPLKGRLRLI